MTTYLPNISSPGAYGALSITANPSLSPILALWMLPLSITQTWLTAWAKPAHTGSEPVFDAPGDGQIPVPAPIEESKDSALFA